MKLFPNIWTRYNNKNQIIQKLENIEWVPKINKTNKKSEKISFKDDWLYFLISTKQHTLLNIGCFLQYFIPMSIVLQFLWLSLQLLYVKFLILCTVWSVWRSKAKYNCTLYHLDPFFDVKFPLTEMNVVFRRTTKGQLIQKWQYVCTQLSCYVSRGISLMMYNVIARNLFCPKKL